MVIVFIIVVGIVHGEVSNLKPFFPNGEKDVFEAATIVFMSYIGFSMVAPMAEETKEPSRDIPIGLVASMSMITVIYCLMTLSLTMMQKYTEIDRNAALLLPPGLCIRSKPTTTLAPTPIQPNHQTQSLRGRRRRRK